MELQGRREKQGSQEQEAQKDHLEKDSLAPREMKERKGAKEIQDRGDFRGLKGQRAIQGLWALLGFLEHQFLDHLGQRETEEDLGCLGLKENLALLFEDQRVPKALEDQWVLQDSKAMAILVWLDLEDYQDPLDQWVYVEWETLEQRESRVSEDLQGPPGLGAREPKGQRVILGRKACLALLVPLATGRKELRENKDLKASRGQRARPAVASLARRGSMENGVMRGQKAVKGTLESPGRQENRGYRDQKETKDLQKKKLSNLFLKYVVVGQNVKRLRWSCCL